MLGVKCMRRVYGADEVECQPEEPFAFWRVVQYVNERGTLYFPWHERYTVRADAEEAAAQAALRLGLGLRLAKRCPKH